MGPDSDTPNEPEKDPVGWAGNLLVVLAYLFFGLMGLDSIFKLFSGRQP